MSTALKPEFMLSNNPVMQDEVVEISLTGLQSWTRITLHLSTEINGTEFTSSADYYSDANGKVYVPLQPPVAGSYQGADAMGLFWSMLAKTPEKGSSLLPTADMWKHQPPQIYQLTAYQAEQKIASTSIERLVITDEVKIIRLKEGRLRGILFIPAGDGPHPALLAVSGSGGGYPMEVARALACRGMAVLALAYFNAPDLPDQLVDIPLEYFGEGIDWLSKMPEIDRTRIGVIGGSRGGELALLLGSTYPSLISLVIAKVPSHVIWPGCCQKEDFDKPSWTWQGEPLTAMPHPMIAYQAQQYWNDFPDDWVGFYWLGLGNTAAVSAAIIEVEKINGPILMISGGDDKCWPSAYMADQVMKRLKECNFPHRYIHLCYDNSGHITGTIPHWPTERMVAPIHPLSDEPFACGGTAKSIALSNTDAWQKTLEFLEEYL